MKSFRISGSTILFCLCMGVVAPAVAQVLDEVVVTAQKRQQDSQDVGIAITAFTGDQLRALGVVQSFDAAAFLN